jgi:hypothetical protein
MALRTIALANESCVDIVIIISHLGTEYQMYTSFRGEEEKVSNYLTLIVMEI